MVRPAIAVVVLSLSSLIVAGCSYEPSRYAASGTVTLDGAPAPFLIVRFHPVASGSMAGGGGPTDEAGQFKIGEDGKNTGFPSGEYKATVPRRCRGASRPSRAAAKVAERDPTEKEAVADDYRDPRKTPNTATIGGGSNSFTFDIKAKK